MTNESAILAEVQRKWPGANVNELLWRRTFLGLPPDAVVLAIRNSKDVELPHPERLLKAAWEETRGFQPQNRRDPTGETIGCRECLDETMVVVDEATNTWRPCMICRPLQYNRWIGGHYDPNHEGCSLCRA